MTLVLVKENLKDNLSHIEGRIQEACARCNRSRDEITLVGVSKTIDPQVVSQSIGLGIKVIAENKPQEVQRKFPLIPELVEWHMIGHLQTNKVKMIIDKVDMIESIDSFKLAQEVHKRAQAIGRVIPILLQVNIGEETQKNGIDIDALEAVAQEISGLSHVHIKGLMCIAPYLEDAEAVRPYFKRMKDLFEHLKIRMNNRDNFARGEMEALSMGMTHDFEVAIEEGATIIRVGTGIYGIRDYQGGSNG